MDEDSKKIIKATLWTAIAYFLLTLIYNMIEYPQ